MHLCRIPALKQVYFSCRRECNEKDESIFFGISERPGKDSRGNTIFKSGADKTWKNVDHDLEEISVEFKKFLVNEEIGW